MATSFVYNEDLQVLICTHCETVLASSLPSITRHFREAPHLLKGPELKHLGKLLSEFTLTPTDQLPYFDHPVPAIPGLRIYQVYRCTICSNHPMTSNKATVQQHISKSHQITASQQVPGRDWVETTAQAYFREKKKLIYFAVESIILPAPPTATAVATTSTSTPLNTFFAGLEATVDKSLIEAKKNDIVQGFDGHKSESVMWLDRTGIASHLEGLSRTKILESTLDPKNSKDIAEGLARILSITDEILAETHASCFTGPNCKLSWASALVMCQFYEAFHGTTSSHHFNHKKSGQVITTYFGYWRRFLIYCYTVLGPNKLDFWFPAETPAGVLVPQDYIQLSSEQADYWTRVLNSAQLKNQAHSLDELRLVLPTFFQHIICFKTYGNAYRSPLISFAAMLAIKPTTQSWKNAGDYNSHLSGIIWVCQLLLFRCSILNAQRSQLPGAVATSMDPEDPTSTHEWLKTFCGKYMRQDEETPMGEILSWRLLLRKISRTTIKDREAFWNEDQTVLTFADTQLHLDQIPRLILSEYQAAYKILQEDLLFASDKVHWIRPGMLKDNMTVTTVEQSFVNLNPELETQKVLLRTIAGSPVLCKLFVADGAWNTHGLAMYEASVQSFLGRLLVLVHMGSGQPLRAPELLSTRWKNTENQLRNIIIRFERVMIHIGYHKGLSSTGMTKDNIRFLPAAIGELVVNFVAFVNPLRTLFLRHTDPDDTLSSHLWSKDGKPWPDSSLSACMERATKKAQIPRLHVANWRQMTVAIVKSKFAADHACFDITSAERDDEDHEDDIQIMNHQRNHTSLAANTSYANMHSAAGIWDSLLHKSLRASTLWAELFKINETLQPQLKRSLSSNDLEGCQMLKKIAVGQPFVRKKWTRVELLAEARRLWSRPGMHWKSRHQALALEYVMSAAEVVVAVLPTGAGKSLLFMLPCMLPDAGVTILVLPLISLRSDMVRRLKELHIQHLVWSSEETRHAPLVLVSAEAASSTSFVAYAQRLRALSHLDRIVIDECHLTITAKEYRQSMVDLASLRTIKTQFLYLTATLPPALEAEFMAQNYLQSPKLVRASADRSNIEFRVARLDLEDTLLEGSASYILEEWNTATVNTHDKAIIYCRTIAAVGEVALLLGCSQYTSQSGDAAQKEQVLHDWLNSSETPFIVATSALGVGFDYPHVRMVYHIDAPSSVIDFAQEFGRAGRDGKASISTVLLPSKWLPNQMLRASSAEAVMHAYLTTSRCLRAHLAGYFDLPVIQPIRCVDDAKPCMNCHSGAATEAPEPESIETPSSAPETELLEARGLSGLYTISDPPGDTTPKAKLKIVPRFTGNWLMEQQAYKEAEDTSSLYNDLEAVKGTCMLCRAMGKTDLRHTFNTCRSRGLFFDAKKERVKAKGLAWFKPYSACYYCALPQSICLRAESQSTQSTATTDRSVTECIFADLVLPFCFGIYLCDPRCKWLSEQFDVVFDNSVDFMQWLGAPLRFGGIPAIQAVHVMYEGLRMLGVTDTYQKEQQEV